MAGYRSGWAQECRPADSPLAGAGVTMSAAPALAEVPVYERPFCTNRGEPVAESDAELREMLDSCQTVAVLGIKTLETEDAYRIPQYMQTHGYRIVPVNPKFEQVLGHRAYPTLREIDEPVDLVNVFRASEHIPDHVDEILAMSPRPKAVWLQLGIHHGEAAAKLRAAGIDVVQDRCIMVEHKRLASD